MNGCLIPDTPIIVDLWRRVSNPSYKHFFLSHMHSDHTQGLSASWRWPIYCSPLSAKMLVEKFQIRELLVRPLELNESHLIQLDRNGKEMMTVTLFDANHCPGSVMFLFEGYFGRILYTGDFRYEPSTYPETFLTPGHPVDKLYLDNTFNNPRCRFQTRSECKEQILNVLKEYPDHEVVLGVYTLGKEDLLVDIALALSTRVVVTPARMRMLQVLELLDVFTTEKDEGHVRLVPRRTISRKNMARWNEEAPTIAIIPTGLFTSLDSQPYINQDDVFIVPYSDHSSYPELRQFVSRVCPRSIVPIVKDSISSSHSVTNMHNFDDLLDRSPSAHFDIPPSVLRFMLTDTHSGPQNGSQDLKKMIHLRRSHSQSHRKNQAAKGVVFLEDHEQEQNQSTEAVEQMNYNVTSQQHQLAENESSNIIDVNTPSPEKILNNSCEAIGSESVSCNSCKVGIKTTSPKLSANTTHLIMKRCTCIQSEAKRDTKTSQDESSHGVSPDNEQNRMPQGSSVTKMNVLTKTCKRQFDEIVNEEHSTCLGKDSCLIRSMSNKRPRVLPAFCRATSKLVENAKSSTCVGTGKKSTARSIQDFFKGLSEAIPTSQQSLRVPACTFNTESKHNPHQGAGASDREKSTTVLIEETVVSHATPPASNLDALLAKRAVDDKPIHAMSLAHFGRINVKPINRQSSTRIGLGDAFRRFCTK